MAKKKVLAVVKIQIPAGQATPAPPVGTALGPHGVAIMDFCKAYNAATEAQRGTIVPVDITVFEDRSFTFVLKTPPTPVLIRQAAGLDKAAANPGRETVGSITDAQVDRDRADQAARPQRQRPRRRQAPGRRHRPQHGHHGQVGSRLDRRTSPVGRLRAARRSSTSPEGVRSAKRAVPRGPQTTRSQHGEGQEVHRRGEAVRPRPAVHPGGGARPREGARHRHLRRVDRAGSVRLGVDPRKADQIVRGTVALPSGTGKDVRVAVFANGEAADAARAAGADHVGGDDLAAQVEGGMLDFDVAIATPDLMPLVGKLGRVLGPRGLMPNPKTGTVTTDVGKAVEEFKGGKVEYRTDRYGNVHVPIGKVSFDVDALQANFTAVLDEIQRAKPASSKGRYIRKISLSPTMGPSVRIDTNRLKAVDADA